MADFQVTQLFIRGGKLADIAHFNAVLVKNAAERIAGGDHIFMNTDFSFSLVIKFILRDRFLFLRSLIDRFTGFGQ
ncbi:hypothetical protein D3C75_313490 [compost metagenome]